MRSQNRGSAPRVARRIAEQNQRHPVLIRFARAGPDRSRRKQHIRSFAAGRFKQSLKTKRDQPRIEPRCETGRLFKNTAGAQNIREPDFDRRKNARQTNSHEHN